MVEQRGLGDRPEQYDQFSSDTYAKLQAQRQHLATLLKNMVGRPQDYPGQDLADAIRDKAKEWGLRFRCRVNREVSPPQVDFFVWDAAFEKPTWEYGMGNPCWLGSAVKGT